MIRAQMDGMLADVNYTYQEIAVGTLDRAGRYQISRSAVGRVLLRGTTVLRGG